MKAAGWTAASIIRVVAVLGVGGLAAFMLWQVSKPAAPTKAEPTAKGESTVEQFAACASRILTKEKTVESERAGEISAKLFGFLTRASRGDKVVEVRVPLDPQIQKLIIESCYSAAGEKAAAMVEVSVPAGVGIVDAVTVKAGNASCSIGKGQTSCFFLVADVENRPYEFSIDDDKYAGSVVVAGPDLKKGIKIPIEEPSKHVVSLTPARTGLAESIVCAQRQGRIACDGECEAFGTRCKRIFAKGGDFAFFARADVVEMKISAERGAEQGSYQQVGPFPERIAIAMRGADGNRPDLECRRRGPDAFRNLQVLRRVQRDPYQAPSIEIAVVVESGRVSRVAPVETNDLAPVVKLAEGKLLPELRQKSCNFTLTWRF